MLRVKTFDFDLRNVVGYNNSKGNPRASRLDDQSGKLGYGRMPKGKFILTKYLQTAPRTWEIIVIIVIICCLLKLI